MQVNTRPSLWFWLLAALIYGFCVLLVLACHLSLLIFVEAAPYDSKVFMSINAVFAAIPAWLYIRRRARRCMWLIDFNGMSSPAFGRIEFSQVIAVYLGYPEAIKPAARYARVLVVGANSHPHLDAGVRILKMADGRLFPLDLESPAISGHADAMAKVTELLVGKIRPGSEFSAADIDALRSRPANRFVSPEEKS